MPKFKHIVIAIAATGTLVAGAQAFGLALASGNTQVSPSRVPVKAVRPVAVELFTSQGCSSCPPADVIAGKFAQDRNIVMITRPVTYWNRLGWTDTLARKGNDDLQRAYARTDMAGAGVYTPQMVINGRVALVGSKELNARSLIKRAKTEDLRASIRIFAAKETGDSRTFLISGPGKGDATVTLVALKSHSTVSVGRGENRGRTLGYYNVLVGETELGNWSGGNSPVTVGSKLTAQTGADRYAIIVRGNKTGRILGASYIS